jgi:molecular chaperone HscB
VSSSAVPVKCWSCGEERPADAPLCAACGKVQPAAPHRPGETRVADKFAMLGVPRQFELDEGALAEAFRALSRKLHPDRFARATPQERRFALEQTTRLNDAHRTLREPARRAEHLLELRGIHLAGEGAESGPAAKKLPVQQPVTMSLTFLEEMMEEREALLEVKHGGGDPERLRETLQSLAGEMEEKRKRTLHRVGEMLRALEEGGARAPAIETVAEQIARLRYYERYLDEALGRGAEV